MAEGETPETGCGNPTDQAQKLIYGAGNLEYQLEQFLESGGQEIKILLSGKTGVGKSRLTNALIGEELAEEGEDVDPQTDKVTAYEFVKNKVKIAVFDTPGLADATGNDEVYLRKIQAKEKKFDLFLFCTELNTIRFRNDDLETIKKLTSTLGLQLWNQAIVVFTFANEVRRSPSKKAKDKPEKDVFNDRFRGFKRKIQESLLDIGVPEEAVMNVPFVPAGDLNEPRLPDRNNWLTAFWIAAFKRINRNVKPAFLVANADRFAFSRVLADDEEKMVSSGLAISGLTTGEVQVIRAVKQKLQETSFAKKLEGCLLKPRVCDEDGTTSTTSIEMDECCSQDVITKKSACSIEMDESSSQDAIGRSAPSIEIDVSSSQDVITKKKSAPSIEMDESSSQDTIARSAPSIEMDESSSQDVITEMVGDITKNLMGDLIGSTFGRFYQTFFGLVIRYLKRILRPHSSLEKPLIGAIKEKREDCVE